MKLGDVTKEMAQPDGIFVPAPPLLDPPRGNESKWTVARESWYVAPDGTVVHLCVGDKTDLASTGRLGKAVFGGPGKETDGAVVHDDGYSKVDKTRYNMFSRCAVVPTRRWWDQTFLHCMKLAKTNVVKRKVFYRVLRMVGWIAWKRYRRDAKK